MAKEFKCEACGYESDEPADFIKNADMKGTFCNDCPLEKEDKEFKSLSEKIEEMKNQLKEDLNDFVQMRMDRDGIDSEQAVKDMQKHSDVDYVRITSQLNLFSWIDESIKEFINRVSHRVLHEKGVDIDDILEEEAGPKLITK